MRGLQAPSRVQSAMPGQQGTWFTDHLNGYHSTETSQSMCIQDVSVSEADKTPVYAAIEYFRIVK